MEVAASADAVTPFVHLHLHSQYSLLDGAIRIEDLVAKAKAYNMPALAITDHGNMFGAVEFYLKCKKAGIKPLIGCELYIAPDSRFSKDSKGISEAAYHLILLCENLEGYKNLSYLTSAGFKEGFYYRPRIDRELLEKHADGLIALSACLKGEVAMQCGRGRMEEAIETARWYADLFPGRYYIELQENTLPEQDTVNKRLLEVARELALPLVATNDCHYLNREDARAHEVLLCIQTGKTMSDPTHMKFSADEFYVKTPQEMAAAFSYVPEAVANTVRIAERCNLELPLEQEYYFPHFEPPAGKSHDDLLAEQARKGLAERLVTIRAKYPDMTPEQEQAYHDRLQVELDCIRAMKFPAYFLIVADFINWAKEHGIPVGPGRGSAAGSLVAYAIRITDLDPLPYNLLFERFLNPERISMPDIDVDFCQDQREKVIDYVVNKYGRDRVCQIITFGTMKAKAVVRDVGRALDMTYGDVDRIAKLIPDDLKMTIEKAIKQEAQLRELAESDPKVKELLETAVCLEGLTRHASTHAAGVVVAPNRMEEFLPVYKDQKTGSINTQYSMKYVEMVGLVKFDFLGLKNLTVIQNAVRLVREGKDPNFDIAVLRDDDKASYDLISSGNTTGIFQLESSGMKEMLVKLKPSCFEDVIAACALYRPGPLGCGMVDDFIERKHGRQKVVYDLPQLEPILKDTYGVIVYQEQVMQISRSLAGYSLGRADLLRRAMGKKDPAVMAKEKEPFLAGAKAQGIDPKKAEAIFDQMAKFAEYGFNKSHSAAYALIAYQTAYLKAHYPVEFMAALLTCDMDSTDKVLKNISDCREQGIEVLPPDINSSGQSFTVVGNSMRFGLGAIKGVGAGAVESIIEARAEGPFTDLYDFCERVDLRRVNKRVLEALIKCGAFDSLHRWRAPLMAALDDAMATGQKFQEERDSAQVSLFGDMPAATAPRSGRKLPNVEEWHDKEKLGYEKEALGFLITGHPLDRYAADIQRLASSTITGLSDLPDGSEVRLCGIVTACKEITTKKGDRMGFVTLEDLTGAIEITVFSDMYVPAVGLLKSDDPLVITGKLEKGEKGCKLLVMKPQEGNGRKFQQGGNGDIRLLHDVQAQATTRVRLALRLPELSSDRLQPIRELLERYPGNLPVQVQFEIPNRSRTTIKLPDHLKVAASDEFRVAVERCVGYNAAIFE
ncbi:DNA polymerase III subunit alpha [Trichlorobacter ammonificans]|uniref:DNA polymerase III subunit alpha n=1 Tax=Trichlorobacter ammonificans TaxID=2916410 RepID=A0ABN8HFY5_9BACT|nr:DNA polymerase III subunit alpha [Trichlorobacter ammonificans]CAH2031728.1 DNA polymerase III subunit alpha [Trichlorobacter ammonificans]